MFELPPTAGLPLHLSDLVGHGENLGDAVSALLDTPRMQYECSGTVCLLIALLTLRRREPKRDHVIVPAYTCPLVVMAIQQAGLQTVVCDVRNGHFDFDIEHLVMLVNERTLVVLPTHLGGRIADVSAAVAVARKFGTYVIEDAAQALGARQQGRSVGLIGDIGFFSLAAGKGLTTYEGGLLLTHDDQLREELAGTSAGLLKNQPGWEFRRTLEMVAYGICYRPLLLGTVYGWPRRRDLDRGDLVAAVGDCFHFNFPRHRAGRWRGLVAARASRRLPAFIQSCSAQAGRRIAQLRRIEGIEVMDDAPGEGVGTWPMLMIVMANQDSRDRALQRLWRSPLGVTRLFIHALPDYPELADRFVGADVPNARDLASRMLTVTNSLWLDDDHFETIAATLRDVAASAAKSQHDHRRDT